MMKKLSIWKRGGAVAAISLPLILGGFTVENISGLESKIQTIGMSTAQAKTYSPEGYQVPNLKGLQPYAKGYLKKASYIYVERFKWNGKTVTRSSYYDGETLKPFAYTVDSDGVPPVDYTLIDGNGDGKFDQKYGPKERFSLPNWVKS